MVSTFITTVLNEKEGIKKLLESLLSQTKKPSEIIIVDGGSVDGTKDIIQSYRKKFKKTSFFVLSEKGNRSKGRNYAIKRAKNQIIVVTDAGCRLPKDWFYKITKPFENKKIDVVAGYYKPVTRNVFEKALSTYTCVMPDKVTSGFLPSSRSVAFKKNAWEKVGGYPEYLDTCEDLVFAKKMKDVGLNFFVAKNAYVNWPQRKNMIEAFWQFFAYAKGDGMARYIRFGTPFLYSRFIIMLALFFAPINLLLKITIIFFLLLFYAFWANIKNYKYVRNIKALLYLPLLQIVSDIAVILGMTYGYMKSFNLQ